MLVCAAMLKLIHSSHDCKIHTTDNSDHIIYYGLLLASYLGLPRTREKKLGFIKLGLTLTFFARAGKAWVQG